MAGRRVPHRSRPRCSQQSLHFFIIENAGRHVPFAAVTIAVVAFFAFLAGAISAVAGFGIGSIMTHVLGLIPSIGVRLAVPAASIPHFVGNAVRLWTLRRKVDVRVLKTFGVMSAAGALTGALLHAVAAITALKIIFAVFLIGFGLLGMVRHSIRIRVGRVGAWIAGFASGLLGGLIGNQGGLRAAAMLALGVPRETFVATAVATALIVDGARMPVYAISSGRGLLAIWPLVVAATVAVIAGTMTGRAMFGRLDEITFRRVVSALLVLLGIAIIAAS